MRALLQNKFCNVSNFEQIVVSPNDNLLAALMAVRQWTGFPGALGRSTI
jgi:hypothetical protein